MHFYTADDITDLSLHLKSGDEIEYLSDEFYDDLNEFEEFTMFHINKLEASNQKPKSKKELIEEQLKSIREARKFAEENDVPVITIDKYKPNE